MMVTFISQCEKNALKRTRRVLDAFADRIGDNVWQTVITQEGLAAVKKLLRKTASKSTAVSCHWIRGRARSELVWIVGDRNKFNERGVVPVNRTSKNVLSFENDWRLMPSIKALIALAALFHDWGKSSSLFQNKLKTNSKLGDPIRHEWISYLLFSSLVESCSGGDDDCPWLTMLANREFDEVQLKKMVQQPKQKHFEQLPPIAKILAWLIISHHRLPNTYQPESWRDESAPDVSSVLKFITQSWGYENKHDEGPKYKKMLNACFEFPNGLLSVSAPWLSQLKKWATRLRDCLPLLNDSLKDGSYRLIIHYVRLCFMLGDHYYSSQNADKNWQNTIGLFANTDKNTKAFKQKLDEHLVGVAKSALNMAHMLPKIENGLPLVQDVRVLSKPSANGFRWQDKAVEEIKTWRKDHTQRHGFFAVNMASTGCGKTFANAKIMRALSVDGNSLRYILALGLRTLTLQTGDEYRERIGLDSSELAVLIGSKAVRELHNIMNIDTDDDELFGSESLEPLLKEDVDYDCDISEDNLTTVIKQQNDRSMLYAPVLACTIDHIIGATETKRGGRYILPSLRLMSSDLVIDEVDDFSGEDLIAIGRLIHLAGMLGRKVMISSATIPPDMAEGYLNTYLHGWEIFSQTREVSKNIGCAWIDEFQTQTITIEHQETYKAVEFYRNCHSKFIEKRITKLGQQVARRKADFIKCQQIVDSHGSNTDETKQNQYFSIIKRAIFDKHKCHNTKDKKTGITVSFGVVRMANIVPCVTLGKYLVESNWPPDVDVKIMTYHSQQVMLLRHEQEQHLDNVLKRKERFGEEPKAFNDDIIRRHLDNSNAKEVLFVLVATPVEEIGRDHDFDWAVIEPSSHRSIIQLAGRIRRHREGEVSNANIALLQYNWKAIKDGNQINKKYFYHPGYEEKLILKTHDLFELIDTTAMTQNINAIPRIQKAGSLNYSKSLTDLEHAVIQSQLANYNGKGPEKLQGYLSEAWYLTALPQVLNKFRKGEPTTKVFLMYDPNKDECVFIEKDDRGRPINREGVLQIRHNGISNDYENRLWLHRDYMESLERYSEQQEQSKKHISLRYGELNFTYRENQEYEYSDQFGLVSKT